MTRCWSPVRSDGYRTAYRQCRRRADRPPLKEFDLLEYLMRNKGRVLGQLIDRGRRLRRRHQDPDIARQASSRQDRGRPGESRATGYRARAGLQARGLIHGPIGGHLCVWMGYVWRRESGRHEEPCGSAVVPTRVAEFTRRDSAGSWPSLMYHGIAPEPLSPRCWHVSARPVPAADGIPRTALQCPAA